MKYQHAGRTIMVQHGVAGQIQYNVSGGVHEFALVGTVYGSPGPVTMISKDLSAHVSAADRFGSQLDLDYVKAWIDAEDADRASLVATSPDQVECPACRSPRGERCTQPTSTGRTDVKWFHLAREDAVKP